MFDQEQKTFHSGGMLVYIIADFASRSFRCFVLVTLIVILTVKRWLKMTKAFGIQVNWVKNVGRLAFTAF